jgi:hypothetical protein
VAGHEKWRCLSRLVNLTEQSRASATAIKL